jgi:hypothetical protein
VAAAIARISRRSAIGVPLPIAYRRRSPIPAGALSKAMLVARVINIGRPALVHNGFNRLRSVQAAALAPQLRTRARQLLKKCSLAHKKQPVQQMQWRLM